MRLLEVPETSRRLVPISVVSEHSSGGGGMAGRHPVPIPASWRHPVSVTRGSGGVGTHPHVSLFFRHWFLLSSGQRMNTSCLIGSSLACRIIISHNYLKYEIHRYILQWKLIELHLQCAYFIIISICNFELSGFHFWDSQASLLTFKRDFVVSPFLGQ